MTDDPAVLEREGRVDSSVDGAPVSSEAVARLPVGGSSAVVGSHIAEAHGQVGAGFAEHVPHGRNLAAAKVCEDRVGEVDLGVVTRRHRLVVSFLEGAIEALDDLLVVAHRAYFLVGLGGSVPIHSHDRSNHDLSVSGSASRSAGTDE